MDAIALQDDLANINFACCISGQGAFVDSLHEVERRNNAVITSSSKQTLQKARIAPKRMSSFNLRKWKPKRTHQPDSGSVVSSSSGDDGNTKTSFDEVFSMQSLLDDDEEDPSTRSAAANNAGNDGLNRSKNTTATSAETRYSTTSHYSAVSKRASIASEVGYSAHEYLEECFYTEISVLNRDKFNAIPEVLKSDFDIKRHLGKGSYSDVFEVVSKRGQLGLTTSMAAPDSKNTGRRTSKARRRASTAFSASITVATLNRPTANVRSDGRFKYALKCLRPQIRSDPEEFTIGAEDIVHETAMLANLDHPNIIKLHGRASGCLTDAFVLNDGYFILLDKLDETLQDRIQGWKKKNSKLALGPSTNQIEVAGTIADAMSYLHSKNVLFRDLKPANVGFDSMGVLKLFDFGFAVGLPEKDIMNPEGLLWDRCGTPRYMSPEVGLSLGYALPSDVYSFGILLWEICALETPFSHIKSAGVFDREVFLEGGRPAMDRRWPTALRELMRSCWCDSPRKRPSMLDVKLQLSMAIFNMNDENSMQEANARSTRMSKVMSRGVRMNSSVVN